MGADDTDWEDDKKSDDFEDAFDEKLLDKFEQEFEKQTAGGMGGPEGEAQNPSESVDSAGLEFKSVFDDSIMGGSGSFPSPEELDAAFKKEFEGEGESAGEVELDPSFSPGAAALAAEASRAAAGRRARIHWGKIILCSVVVLMLAVGTILGVKRWRSAQKGKPLGVAMVRHPIPQFIREERLEFLLLAHSVKNQDLLSVELEVTMREPNAYDFFRRQKVSIRDAVYRFLLNQKPSDNSFRNWQDLLETSLLAYLKTTLPQFPVESLRVTSLEKL